MQKTAFIIALSFVFSLLALISCNDDFDNYSTSSGDILTFSVDTLRFDTVLTGINTPVSSFMIYNNNDKSLLISSIQLKNAGVSGFKINVDGIAGTSFESVEIRSKDSLFVFVDIKPNELNQNRPTLIEDEIQFVTNSVQQKVTLEAYGQDVRILRGVVFSSDAVLDSQKPYLIYDSLKVEEGSTLNIEAGATLYLHKNAQIIVEGTLKAKGNQENVITFRGDRMDQMIGVSYDLIPGQWEGIYLGPNSYNNELEYVQMRNGENGLYLALSEPNETKISIKNSILTNFRGTLIQSLNAKIIAENCEFSNSQGALLNMVGGSCHITHCTFANYYWSPAELGWGNSDNSTIILSNNFYSTETESLESYPITEAYFANTLIWGLKENGGSGIVLRKDENSSMAYHFLNCLIPNKGENDDDFVGCIFNENPQFADYSAVKNNKYEFAYNFRLTEESPARDIANPETARLIPYDLDNIDRFLDGKPDIGAYEWFPSESE